MKFIFLLSLPLYALDQLSKYLVLQNVEPKKAYAVVDGFFHIVNVTNTGAAFGSFKNNNEVFIGISCVALLVVLVLLLRRTRTPDVWRDISLGMLLAGILGNLTDRLLYGHVIDFLLFDFGPHAPDLFRPWPAFNVADSCITIAVVFFVIHSFFQPKAAPAPAIHEQDNS